MKETIIFIFISFFSVIIFITPSYTQDSDSFQPTQPPRIPVADYDIGPHRIVDFMYLNYSFEEFTLEGFGAGFNYVSTYNDMAYNLGIGIIKMKGSSTDLDPELRVHDTNLPLNANIGLRISGNSETNNVMIFGGLHWMYSWIDVTWGDVEASAYGPAFGPLFGIKGELKLNPSLSFIPYYVFHHSIFDIDVEVEGTTQSADIDPVTSHLIGFDIKIGGISVGALLDTINNTDNDKLTILCTYDLDYNTGNEEQNMADTGEKKKTRKDKQAEKTGDTTIEDNLP